MMTMVVGEISPTIEWHVQLSKRVRGKREGEREYPFPYFIVDGGSYEEYLGSPSFMGRLNPSGGDSTLL